VSVLLRLNQNERSSTHVETAFTLAPADINMRTISMNPRHSVCMRQLSNAQKSGVMMLPLSLM
jgi:hypothetical protein